MASDARVANEARIRVELCILGKGQVCSWLFCMNMNVLLVAASKSLEIEVENRSGNICMVTFERLGFETACGGMYLCLLCSSIQLICLNFSQLA